MRSIILATVAVFALFGHAEAKVAKGCTTQAECDKVDGDGGIVKTRKASATMQACSAKWKALKAEPTDTNVETVKRGWIPFWSACAKEVKAARTLAP